MWPGTSGLQSQGVDEEIVLQNLLHIYEKLQFISSGSQLKDSEWDVILVFSFNFGFPILKQ